MMHFEKSRAPEISGARMLHCGRPPFQPNGPLHHETKCAILHLVGWNMPTNIFRIIGYFLEALLHAKYLDDARFRRDVLIG